jgi:hypothetical protein
MQAQDTVATLLQKISALASVNREIASRISSKKEVTRLEYEIVYDSQKNQFVSAEVATPFDARSITTSWRSKVALNPIEDIFNDNLQFGVAEFDSLMMLNEKMLAVAQKYKLFGESEPAREKLRQFLTNFELVQTAIGSLESDLQDSTSGRAEVAQNVAALNLVTRRLTHSNWKIKILAGPVQMQVSTPSRSHMNYSRGLRSDFDDGQRKPVSIRTLFE